MTVRRNLACLAAALCAIFLLASPASAAELDELRRSGAVAERFDGYVEARGAASAETQRVVEAVNAQRRQVYQKRAAEQNVPVAEVGKIYFTQILNNLPGGAWIKRPDGSYAQK